MTERRTAIVVGGAGGIGGAVCRKLAEDGLRIVVADRNLEQARTVAGTLSGDGHSCELLDFTAEIEVDTVFDRVEAEAPIAVLVAIAGGSLSNIATAEMSMSEWDATIALNITGNFLTVRKFAALRAKAPVAHGRIVSFSSFAGESGLSPTGVAYAAAKAGVIGLTRHVAFELAASGITVNAVAPGAVGTDAFNQYVTDEVKAAILAQVPARRLATPDEIANCVGFLVSEQATYVTGMTLDVNGGALMR